MYENGGREIPICFMGLHERGRLSRPDVPDRYAEYAWSKTPRLDQEAMSLFAGERPDSL